MTKTLTFIARQAPYASSRARACMDMAMSAAVFDQHVQLVFMDGGVWQLVPGQAAEKIPGKSLGAALPAMSLYGIEQVHVCSASLAKRQLTRADLLSMEIRECDEATIRQLIASSDQVFVF